MKENIYILGSAGFIGANLIRYILYNYKDYNIIGIDKIKNYINLHNVYMNKCQEFYIADIDSHTVDVILKQHKPDYIINLVPATDYKTALKVSKFLEKTSLYSIKKIIQLNEISIYKNSEDVITEKSELSFENKKNVSSIFIEKMIEAHVNEHIKTISDYHIIRHDEIFGPRKKDGLISEIYRGTKFGNIYLSNEGLNKRNLLYIEDVCNAVMLVLNSGDEHVYNLSSGSDFNDLELTQMVISILNQNPQISSVGALFNSYYLNIDATKIKNLGWKPNKFKDRLKYTINWYETNKWIFK